MPFHRFERGRAVECGEGLVPVICNSVDSDVAAS
jgi:hypothetical protein